MGSYSIEEIMNENPGWQPEVYEPSQDNQLTAGVQKTIGPMDYLNAALQGAGHGVTAGGYGSYEDVPENMRTAYGVGDLAGSVGTNLAAVLAGPAAPAIWAAYGGTRAANEQAEQISAGEREGFNPLSIGVNTALGVAPFLGTAKFAKTVTDLLKYGSKTGPVGLKTAQQLAQAAKPVAKQAGTTIGKEALKGASIGAFGNTAYGLAEGQTSPEQVMQNLIFGGATGGAIGGGTQAAMQGATKTATKVMGKGGATGEPRTASSIENVQAVAKPPEKPPLDLSIYPIDESVVKLRNKFLDDYGTALRNQDAPAIKASLKGLEQYFGMAPDTAEQALIARIQELKAIQPQQEAALHQAKLRQLNEQGYTIGPNGELIDLQTMANITLDEGYPNMRGQQDRIPIPVDQYVPYAERVTPGGPKLLPGTVDPQAQLDAFMTRVGGPEPQFDLSGLTPDSLLDDQALAQKLQQGQYQAGVGMNPAEQAALQAQIERQALAQKLQQGQYQAGVGMNPLESIPNLPKTYRPDKKPGGKTEHRGLDR